MAKIFLQIDLALRICFEPQAVSFYSRYPYNKTTFQLDLENIDYSAELEIAVDQLVSLPCPLPLQPAHSDSAGLGYRFTILNGNFHAKSP